MAVRQPQPLLLCAVCCVVQAILAVILGPIAGDVFRLQTSLSPSAARAIVAGWAPEDEQRFRWHFYLDGLYPLLYALLMRRRARALLPPSPIRSILLGAATIGALCDCAENALHWSALPDLGRAPDWILRAAAVAALCKWLCLVPTAVLLVPYSPLTSTLAKTIPFRPGLAHRMDALLTEARTERGRERSDGARRSHRA